jgi:L-arabinokinase
MAAVVWYVTAHGFGHAVRSAPVLAELRRRAPALELHVRAAAPAWLFPAGVHYHHLVADVGLVQRDGLTQDLAATLARATAFAAEFPAAVAREVGFLRQVDAALVVGDVPPLAFRAAHAAGLAAVGMANFSWDWIYAHFAAEHPAFGHLAEAARDAYATAALLLRLPLHGDLSAFPRRVDVPLVARPTSLSRQACRERLDLPPDRKVVLLSFGGDGLDRFPFARLAAWPEYLFLTTDRAPEPRPANLRVLGAQQPAYQELVRACDAIVAKPGYGIVADCLAAQTPMLYTDRGDFPEYPILVVALEASGPARHLPREELLAGEVGPALEQLLALDRPWRVPRLDGAAVAAEQLLEFLDRQQATPPSGGR